jgi:hypothetical protein
MTRKTVSVQVMVAACLFGASASLASTVSWVNWSTSYTKGETAGAASGVTSGPDVLNVSYSGEVQSVVPNYPSWTPTSSYTGGGVDNAPPQAGGIVQIYGGAGTSTDTITFSEPVVNPVMAIWSLGSGGTPATFNFSSDEIFTIVAGGPSAEYGGGTITKTGNNVNGAEGNGVIMFQGTFTSLTWTTPGYEDWYGFTVGVTSTVPLPSEIYGGAGLLLAVGGVKWVSGRRRKV